MQKQVPSKSLSQRLRVLLNRLEFDRAVFFGILAKIWGVTAGPVTAVLIITKFTPEYQGYYYTFASLLSLQVFVELGLGTVIVQFASHEWSKLKIDDSGFIVGDKQALSRLVSLADITFKWYLIGGVVIASGLGLGGYIFFAHLQNHSVNWVWPWLSLCIFTGIGVCIMPALALLEGCNQVAAVYTYRFLQGIVASLSIWVAIFLGANLWAATISAAAIILCSLLFLKYKYYNFIKSLLFSTSLDSRINWRKEIFPLQWRIALSWISGYFVFSFFTPVIFRYYGSIVAGQFGMTWSVISMVSRISNSWLYAKVPRFGMLIAKKQYAELDLLFNKLTKIFVVVTILAAISIWFVIYIFIRLKFSFITRLLPLSSFTVFLIAEVIMMLSVPFSLYLIAHKKNPLVLVSVLTGLAVSVSTLIIGKYYSVTAIAFGYLVINIIIVLSIIIIWYRCRIKWHQGEDGFVDTVALAEIPIVDEAGF